MPKKKVEESEWQINVTAQGEQALGFFKRMISKTTQFKNAFFNAGLGIIYLDRLIYSAVNSFRRLNDVMHLTEAAQYARDVNYISDALEINVERMQSFQYALGTVGVDPRDMKDAIFQIDQLIAEFVSGDSKQRTEAFTKWGFTVNDFLNEDLVSQLTVIADKVEHMTRRKRDDALSKMFGEDLAKKLGPLLALGKGPLLSKMKEAYYTGAVLTKTMSENLSTVFVLFRFIGNVVTNMARQINGIFSPVLVSILTEVAKKILEISIIFQNKANKQIKYFQMVLDDFPATLMGMSWSLEDINKNFEGIGNTLFRVFKAGSVGFLLYMLIFNPMFIAALTLGLGAMALAIAVIDDLMNFNSGEESLFGEMLKNSPAIQAYFMLFKTSMIAIWEILEYIGQQISDIFSSEGIVFLIGDAFTIIMQLVTAGLAFVGLLAKGVSLLVDAYAVLHKIAALGVAGILGAMGNFNAAEVFAKSAFLSDKSTPNRSMFEPAKAPWDKWTMNITNNVTSTDPTATINSLTNNVVEQTKQNRGR